MKFTFGPKAGVRGSPFSYPIDFCRRRAEKPVSGFMVQSQVQVLSP